jgi:hypothetical protein
MSFPTPWGAYRAGHASNTSTSLYDFTGNGRNATISGTAIVNTTASGNGATASVPYFTGTTETTIRWPSGSIPTAFTMCSITRYASVPTGTYARVLNGSENFIHGHYKEGASTYTGVAFYGSVFASPKTTTALSTVTDWLVMCGVNGTSISPPNNILANGTGVGNTYGGVGIGYLTINTGPYPEQSNFAFQQVLIWDQALTVSQLQTISSTLLSYLSSGSIYYPWEKIPVLPGLPNPWGAYVAGNSRNTSTSLYDFTGNGRNATISGTAITNATGSGYGAIASIPYITGTTSSLITWPTGSYPTTFTICSITRYNGGSKNRILVTTSGNNLHGHWVGRSGVAHYDGFKTSSSQSTAVGVDDWVVMCGTNSLSVSDPNNILVNGVASGTAYGGPGGLILSINGGMEPGDFAFQQVFIWDQGLTASQMVTASKMLMNYLVNRTYNIITVPSTIPRPWGAYRAGHTNNTSTSLYDFTGNGRNATISGTAIVNAIASGNGAAASVPYFTGTTATKIEWPSGSVPTTFTICSITRYNGGTRKRIIDSSFGTVLNGHWDGKSGIAYYGGFKTLQSQSTAVSRDDWVVMCGTNDSAISNPNNIITNGVASGSASGGTGGVTLYINRDESSDFAFQQVLIWDKGLTVSQLTTISSTLMNYLSFGNINYYWESIHKPWGAYIAGHSSNTSTSLYDFTGNGRNATISGSGLSNTSGSGSGATATIPYMTGTTSTKITWPSGSVPSTFTICSITRYNSGTKKRIFDGSGINFFHGHWDGKSGVAFYNTWKVYQQSNVVGLDDWVVMCGTNSLNVIAPNNILVNSFPVSGANGGSGGSILTINNGNYASSEASDFALQQVLIWDQGLSSDQMMMVSNDMLSYLANSYTTYYPSNSIYYPYLQNFEASSYVKSTEYTIPKPWGAYIAGHASNTSTSLYDFTGNGRNATISGTAIVNATASGNGASASVPYFTGTTGSKILWPSGSIPSTFTICSITRYNGTTRQRVIDSTSGEVLHGHWFDKSGIAYYGGFKTSQSQSTVVGRDDWVVMCGTNSTSVAIQNNILINGVASGSANGGTGGFTLCINNGPYGEESDFAFQQVLIWDQALTADQMAFVSSSLLGYLSSGNIYYPWLSNALLRNGSFFEHSYPPFYNSIVYYTPIPTGQNLPFYPSTGLVTSNLITSLFSPWEFESITANTNVFGLIQGNDSEYNTGLTNGSHCIVVRQLNNNASLRVFQTLTLFPGTYQLTYRLSARSGSTHYSTSHKFSVTTNVLGNSQTTSIRSLTSASVGFSTYYDTITISSMNQYSINFNFQFNDTGVTNLYLNTSSIFLTDVGLSRSLSLYYPFDQNISNYATGTAVTNGVTYGVDISTNHTVLSSGSLYFPATNIGQRFELSTIPTLSNTTGLTFSLWVKFISVPTQTALPNYRLFQTNSTSRNNNIVLYFYNYNSDAPYLTSEISNINYVAKYNDYNITMNDQIWHHYCMTISPNNVPYSGTYTLQTYLDGSRVLKKVITAPYPDMSLNQFIIGQSSFSSDYDASLNQPVFYINDFMLYNRELPLDEISILYKKVANTKLVEISKFNYLGLMSYYPLDVDMLNYATGTGIDDATETLNANSGIKTGKTRLTSGSLYLSQRTDEFKIKSTKFLKSGITIALWMNFEGDIDSTAYTRIFDFGNFGVSPRKSILFNLNPSTLLYQVMTVIDGNFANQLAGKKIDYSWHHYCVTFDTSGNVRVFLDGLKIIDASLNVSYNTLFNSCFIGSSGDSGETIAHAVARINSVMVFNRVLVPSEIGLIMNFKNTIINGNFNNFRLSTGFNSLTNNTVSWNATTSLHLLPYNLTGWSISGSITALYVLNGPYIGGAGLTIKSQQYALVFHSTTDTTSIVLKQNVFLTPGRYVFKYKAFGQTLQYSTDNKLTSRILDPYENNVIINTPVLSTTSFYNNDQVFTVTYSGCYTVLFQVVNTTVSTSAIILTSVEIEKYSFTDSFLLNNTVVGDLIATVDITSGQTDYPTPTPSQIDGSLNLFTFNNANFLTDIVQNRPLYMHGSRNPLGFRINNIDIGHYYQQTPLIDGSYGYCYNVNTTTIPALLKASDAAFIWSENNSLAQTTVSYWLYYTFNYTGSNYSGTMYSYVDDYAVIYLNNIYVANINYPNINTTSVTLVYGLNYIRVGVFNTAVDSGFIAAIYDGASTPVLVAKTSQNWTWSMVDASYTTQYIYPSSSLPFTHIPDTLFTITSAEYYKYTDANFTHIVITSTSSYDLSGTIVFNGNLSYVLAIVIGGGGAGGSSSWTEQGGSGGGGGGVVIQKYTNVTSGTSYQFKVGRGGDCKTVSGTASTGSGTDNIMESGKPSTFGTLIANGGGGGRGGGNGYSSVGGTGGTASGGLNNITGGVGGRNNTTSTGVGGSGVYNPTLSTTITNLSGNPSTIRIHNLEQQWVGTGGNGGGYTTNSTNNATDGNGMGAGYRSPGVILPYFNMNGKPNTGSGGGGGGGGLLSDQKNNLGGNGGSGVIYLRISV